MKNVVFVFQRAARVGALVALVSSAGILPARGQGVTGSLTDPRAHLAPGTTKKSPLDSTYQVVDKPAQELGMNMTLISHRAKPDSLNFMRGGALNYLNSDLAFGGHYLYQGNFSGFTIWDIANPATPVLKKTVICATDQGDPSIYGHLLFISDESTRGRLDCGMQGIQGAVSKDRVRGVRVFDIADPLHPKQVADIQTCRGSHTHTLVPDPTDKSIVYIYISGTSGVRSPEELAGCVGTTADDPASATFRVEVIKVPLAHPEQYSLVTSARIFNDLPGVRGHGNPPGDTLGNSLRGGRGGGRGGNAAQLNLATARTAADTARINKTLDSLRVAGVALPAAGGRGGRGAGGRGAGGRAGAAPPTNPAVTAVVAALGAAKNATDSARANKTIDSLRAAGFVVNLALNEGGARAGGGGGRGGGPNQCHDITVYPAVGLAGGACGGYGLLLDIKDVAHPVRIQAVSDSNFAFWHSATFTNDGSKLLFSDEWGGGQAARCRSVDPVNWGGDAIFDLKDNHLTQASYYKIPAAQTEAENCVAHNGALIPVPGRDIMSQGWYQGGVSVFDFSDSHHPFEIAYFDRGPIDSTIMVVGGYWCAYWYNGHIYASELTRGLDVFDLKPSAMLSANEIAAAKLVKFSEFNPQSQPKFVWPAAFPVVRSYLDQLVRGKGLAVARTTALTTQLKAAEAATGPARKTALTKIATALDKDAATAQDGARVKMMAEAVRDLAKATK